MRVVQQAYGREHDMTNHDASVPAQPMGDELPLPAGVAAASPWIRLGAVVLESVLVLVTLGIGWIIWALMIVGRGQTPAKALLNLRVIDTGSLKPVGFARMFWVREIVAGIIAGVAIPLTIGVLLFMPFWDRHNQNLWDKISSTYVVLDPSDAWSTKPDLPR